MSTATHIPTKLMKVQGAITSNQAVNFGDTTGAHWVVGIVIAGSAIPSTLKTGIQYISDVTGTNTEMSYSGYVRQNLSSIVWDFDGSASGQVDWSFANITFSQQAADPGTGRYGFIAWLGGSGAFADSAAPVVAILDFGQTVSTVNGSLVLQCPSGGLIQYTGGG